MRRHNNGHRRALEKIATHPDKFGFHNILSVSIETTLYHRGRIVAQPDIIFETEKEEIHLIEYKGKGNGELLDRALKQLAEAKWWYGKHKDIPPEKIYTHLIAADDPKYKDLLKGL